MSENIWTVQSLLNYIYRSKLRTSRQIRDSKSLQNEHDKIVALLKAFDLYAEEKQFIFNKKHKVRERYGFDISDFLRGNFIRKRTQKDVDVLLQYLSDNNMIKWDCPDQEDEYSFLCRTFRHLISFQRDLKHSIDVLSCYTQMPILRISLNIIKQQARIIDFVLLKIIGEKEPVSEKLLKEKYGFPVATKPEKLTGFKTVDEILAEL